MCLHGVAAAEKAVVVSRDIVGYSPLTLLVPHVVSLLLSEKKSSHLAKISHYTPLLAFGDADPDEHDCLSCV